LGAYFTNPDINTFKTFFVSLVLEEPQVALSCLRLPRTPRTSQDIPGHPRTPQDTPGVLGNPQEFSGILRTPQVAIRLNSGCTQVVLRLCLGHHQTLRLLQFILGF